MKVNQLLLTFIVFLLSTTIYAQQPMISKKQSTDFKKLEWLLGKWNRTNGKPGQITTEEWVKESAFKLKGMGVMRKGADTAFVEKMTLLVKDNAIFFVADVKENNGLVYFKLTTITSNGFTCENPEHDFPKKIVYKLAGKDLQATISGNGKSIDYSFARL